LEGLVADLTDKLRRWIDVPARTAAGLLLAEEDVRALEISYAVSLPEDFREYLLHAAPEHERIWDDGDVLWWPITDIKNVPDEYEHGLEGLISAAHAEKTLFFADFMIWCWAWAICCDDNEHRGKIILVGRSPDKVVANSFTEFAESYLRDPKAVGCGDPPRS
jgi:hypothetical protein